MLMFGSSLLHPYVTLNQHVALCLQAAATLVGAAALAVAPPAAADAPAPWQFGFQDSATSTAQVTQQL
jgi:hypothetical protein